MKKVTKGKKKGFTLIELIAVIAILGILAAILIPNIISYIDNAKIAKTRTEISEVYSGIMAQAATQNKTAEIETDQVQKAMTKLNITEATLFVNGSSNGSDTNAISIINTTPVNQLPAIFNNANSLEVTNGQVVLTNATGASTASK